VQWRNHGDGARLPLAGRHRTQAPIRNDLGLQAAGVQTDQRGFIRGEQRLETSVPGVWALGDVNGGPAFTHISFNDYQIVYATWLMQSPHHRQPTSPLRRLTDPSWAASG